MGGDAIPGVVEIHCAADPARTCQVAGIDIFKAVEGFHANAAPALGDASDEGVAAWLTALKGDLAVGTLAGRAGRSRYAVSRWLAGRTRPRVPDFLRLIDAITARLPDFVDQLVPIEQVPVLRAVHERTQRARRLLADEPWAVAVLALLETREFSDGSCADADAAAALGIDRAVAGRCIDQLVAARVLSRVA